MNAPTLRPYQDAGLTAIVTTLPTHNRQLLQMATGTGKTVLFAELLKKMRDWLEQFPARERRMLVIAHREELLDQAAGKIYAANPGIMVSVEQADRHANSYSDVVVASIQTLQSQGTFKRLHRLLAKHRFRIVIIDEAHHAAAPSYRNALVHLGFLPRADLTESTEVEAAKFDDVAKMEQALAGWDLEAPKDQLLLGVTATPNRSDSIGLGCVFQSLVFSYPIKQAIDDGYLVPPVPWTIETKSSLDTVKITAGEFNQKDLAEAVNNAERNRLAVQGWFEKALGLPTIAFTVDVQHAHDLADAFNRAGAVARPLSGKTPKEERRQLLKDYAAGKVQIICNCMVLTEGTDLPLTACILHAKPTKSATLYEQMTGRGLRVHPDDPAGPERLRYLDRREDVPGRHLLKPECVVLDLVDVSRRHSLQTAPVLYGLPPNLKTDGKTLAEVEADLEAFREKHPHMDLLAALVNQHLSLQQLEILASRVDPFAIKPLGPFGDDKRLDWLRVGEDTYRLTYPWEDGQEVLEVQRDLLQKFELVRTYRAKDGSRVQQQTLAAGVLSADECGRIAESYVATSRSQVLKLKEKDAPWKQRPASDKQVKFLQRLRVPFKPPLTMGQAGRLIDIAMARRGPKR